MPSFLKWFLLLGVAGLIVLGSFLRPVPIVSEEKALAARGMVQQIHGGGDHDIVFVLRNHPTRYYINRGEELGLSIPELKAQLIGREVEIKYPDYWTPLNANNSVRHLSKLSVDGEVIFNELK